MKEEEIREKLFRLIEEITNLEDTKNSPAMVQALAELFSAVKEF